MSFYWIFNWCCGFEVGFLLFVIVVLLLFFFCVFKMNELKVTRFWFHSKNRLETSFGRVDWNINCFVFFFAFFDAI